MKIFPIKVPEDLEIAKSVVEKSFSVTPDSLISEWFSFSEMIKNIHEGRGVCLKAVSGDNQLLGILYAQQENPINGKEGLDKWVIVLAAVLPDQSGKGVGSALLTEAEDVAKERGASKMFVYTNKDDEKVINFYRKNGYEDAGWIKDYQYGKDNSAVFLLKYL